MEISKIVCKTSLSPSNPIIMVTKSEDEKVTLVRWPLYRALKV